MAYDPLLNNEIEVGDPVKKELFDKIKGNLDDHESRLQVVEANQAKLDFLSFLIMNAASFSQSTGVFYYKSNNNFTITDVNLEIFEVGTLTGFLEIDILHSTTDKQNSSFTSIFTTKPKIDFSTAVDEEISSNQAFDAGQINVSVGDYLRLDITQMPVNGVLGKFLLNTFGET